jgi:hypothetical protein
VHEKNHTVVTVLFILVIKVPKTLATMVGLCLLLLPLLLQALPPLHFVVGEQQYRHCIVAAEDRFTAAEIAKFITNCGIVVG